MAFDWKEFLKIAKAITGKEAGTYSDEAGYRCAVSRSYYAAFGDARRYAMQNLNFVPTYTSKDHGLLRNYFRHNRMGEVATKLDFLRQWRNDCDYKEEIINLLHILDNSINHAEKVINILR